MRDLEKRLEAITLLYTRRAPTSDPPGCKGGAQGTSLGLINVLFTIIFLIKHSQMFVAHIMLYFPQRIAFHKCHMIQLPVKLKSFLISFTSHIDTVREVRDGHLIPH